MNKKIIYKLLISIFLYQTTLSMENNNNHQLIDTKVDSIKITVYKRNETGKLIRERVPITRESTLHLIDTLWTKSGTLTGYKVKIQTPIKTDAGTKESCWTCYIHKKYAPNIDTIIERKKNNTKNDIPEKDLLQYLLSSLELHKINGHKKLGNNQWITEPISIKTNSRFIIDDEKINHPHILQKIVIKEPHKSVTCYISPDDINIINEREQAIKDVLNVLGNQFATSILIDKIGEDSAVLVLRNIAGFDHFKNKSSMLLNCILIDALKIDPSEIQNKMLTLISQQ